MKKIAVFSMLICSTLFVKAQDGASKGDIKFSAGAELGLPIGDFGSAFSLVAGASAQGDYYLSDKLALTLNAGYVSYVAEGGSVDIIPVLGGAKYWFSENLYGAAQAGLSFGTTEGAESEVTIAPGVGYRFSKIDVQLKYNSILFEGAPLNNIGLRVAYTF